MNQFLYPTRPVKQRSILTCELPKTMTVLMAFQDFAGFYIDIETAVTSYASEFPWRDA